MRSFVRSADSVRIVFGPGRLGSLREELAQLGARRVAVLCTAGRTSLAERVASALASPEGALSAIVVAQAREHVPQESVDRALAELDRAQADTVLTVGGGSAIGLGKALALSRDVRLAVLATTYSGSEMTPIFGITTGEGKRTGRDERVRPRLVVYDPELTLGLGVAMSVTSGFNALAHAVEALYAKDGDPVTRLVAAEAARTIVSALPAVAAAPSDVEARAELLYGSHLAGCCLSGASMGLHHKLAHVLGGSFSLPHAATHTVMLPHVVSFNAKAAPAAIRALAEAMGAADPAGALFDLRERLGAPGSLEALGMPREQIEDAARIALEQAYDNPREATRADLERLLEDAWLGRRPSSSRGAARAAATAPKTREYLRGFGASLCSEALPGALPARQNGPRRPAYGLYAEQVNGTPFTAQRALNRRVWLYRVRPSVGHGALEEVKDTRLCGTFEGDVAVPSLARWSPLEIPSKERPTDFVDGLSTFGGCGAPELCRGIAIHLYACNASMKDRAFYDADGDLLIVPERGELAITTEMGRLDVAPGEVCVIGRGLKFAVDVGADGARGFVLEVYDGPLRLPERGLIGANGLADERHFLAPTAWYEDREVQGYELLVKHGGRLFSGRQDHSPFDVVAWHGNHLPYKYDLAMFNSYGSVTWDHPDPSILTVLTCPMDDHGRSAADFVVFAGRWEVGEDTFRPPFCHRNAATEFNAVIKQHDKYHGFEQGCFYLSPTFTAHGVNADSYDEQVRASDEQAEPPHRIPDESLWVMFESAYTIRLTEWARSQAPRDPSYAALFSGYQKYFDPKSR